jgi:DNA-binding Lrp family transcriptional regulator
VNAHYNRNDNTLAGKLTLKGMQLSEFERHLVNDFQRGFPLSPTPYADVAARLGVTEQEVIEALERLQATGIVSRVGAVFRPNRVGVSTLAAMSVPAHSIDAVAAIVNACPEVNHNYEREHAYNLWFVVTAPDEARLQQALARIEQQSGYPVLSLPMQEDYHIDLGFPLQWEAAGRSANHE